MRFENCNVINANHERVLIVMRKYLSERHMAVCGCPRCVSDIAAIALNYLPPHYVCDVDKSKEYGSPWVMVEIAVSEAISLVMKNTRHPKIREKVAAQGGNAASPTIVSPALMHAVASEDVPRGVCHAS